MLRRAREDSGIALTICRYALLTSLLVHGFILLLAALEVAPWEPLLLAAIVSLGWIVLSATACLALQSFAFLRRRLRR